MKSRIMRNEENAYPKVQIGVSFINQSFKDQCCIFSSFNKHTDNNTIIFLQFE